MTDQESFFVRLTALAKMCPYFQLTPEVVRLYDENLSPLGYDRLVDALDRFITERNSRDPFPSIKEIRVVVEPDRISDESLAMEAVNRIMEAISRYGPYNHERSMIYIGSIGKEVVKRCGGWQEVCQIDEVGVFRAQALRIARSVIELHKTGNLGDAPEFPEQEKKLKALLGPLTSRNVLAARPWDREDA